MILTSLSQQLFLLKRFHKLLSLLFALSFLVACNEGGGFKPKISAGDKVPASEHRTAAEAGSRKAVCSMERPDNLHKWKISELRKANKPFLVVFGTPQHCTMCVDQLIRVASLQEKYGDRFAFLHVDEYRDDAVWVEWGVKGEPWTFIVDQKGIVRKVFPGPTDLSVMELVIDEIIKEQG